MQVFKGGRYISIYSCVRDNRACSIVIFNYFHRDLLQIFTPQCDLLLRPAIIRHVRVITFKYIYMYILTLNLIKCFQWDIHTGLYGKVLESTQGKGF